LKFVILEISFSDMTCEFKSSFHNDESEFYLEQQKQRELDAMENRLEMEIVAWMANIHKEADKIEKKLMEEAKSILRETTCLRHIKGGTELKFYPRTIDTFDFGYFIYDGLSPNSMQLVLLTDVSKLTVNSPIVLLVKTDGSSNFSSKIGDLLKITVASSKEDLEFSQKIDAKEKTLSISFVSASERLIEVNVRLFKQHIIGSPFKIPVLKDPLSVLDKKMIVPRVKFAAEDDREIKMINCSSNKFNSNSRPSNLVSSGNLEKENAIVEINAGPHSSIEEPVLKNTKLTKGMMVYARKDETHPWNNAIIQEVMAEGRIFIVKFVKTNVFTGVSPANIVASLQAILEGERIVESMNNNNTKLSKGMMVYARKGGKHIWCKAIIYEVMSEGRLFVVKGYVKTNEFWIVTLADIAASPKAIPKGERIESMDDNNE